MNNTKAEAKKFLSENKISKGDYNAFKKTAENLGYFVIEYCNGVNNPDVASVIENLNLSEFTYKSKGFTYASDKYRLIFIREDLSLEEKKIILAHELGHIVLHHFNNAEILGNDVKEEYEANEFAHYIIYSSFFDNIKCTVGKNKKKTIAIASIIAVLAITIGGIIYYKNSNNYGEYYITEHGKKYHKESCYYIQNNKNAKHITKEEFKSGDYAPCKICLPEKQ